MVQIYVYLDGFWGLQLNGQQGPDHIERINKAHMWNDYLLVANEKIDVYRITFVPKCANEPQFALMGGRKSVHGSAM